MARNDKEQEHESLLDSLRKLTGQVAGGTLEIARNTATMTAMFGESWLRNNLLNQLEPERLEAMADAGRFLRDARETAGMSIKELTESLGLSDKSVIEDIESGQTIMPLELMLRSTSLLARHDPIPFLIKFMRTYNPSLEHTLEQWGILALPKQYERERRFVNLYRQHDVLRNFSDEEYDRFIHYIESSTNLVLDVMKSEKDANASTSRSKPARKTTAGAASARKKSAPKKATPKRKAASKKSTTRRKRPPAAKRSSS